MNGAVHRVRTAASAGIIAVAVAAAVAPGLFARHNPLQMHPSLAFAGPGGGYVLGTDEFGRDILARIVYGARASLEVAAGSVLLAGAVGTALGVIGGYAAGIWEALAMRTADVILCFPPILLAMLVAGFLGAGVGHLILIIGFLYIPQFGRLAFAQTLAVRGSEFVDAARAAGASTPRILRRAILPSIAGPLIVQTSILAASAMLLESGLSFLGLGVLPPAPSWGLMIATARNYMFQNPYYVLWPSLALSVTILSTNTLGDALLDRMDPRLRRR
jgi:ABC-type dipeptide/oligopeptide/nickel transport system permease subunit